ncbi:MAG: HD domain-containing protein [Nanoarchaeota archaeon]
MFFEIAQLKTLYRQGWLRNGIPEKKCESVADHCCIVAMLGYAIAREYRPDLDPARVMELGMFHEIGEIYAGDIGPHDGISLEEKARREYDSVLRVTREFPNSQRYVDLWLEFDRKTSPEAKFVSQIDRLELALQTSLYSRAGYRNLDEFFKWCDERINDPELREMFSAIPQK